MDGSITASASLRMRTQLRSLYQAPAGGGDAGLFEELLRMPVIESRTDADRDMPSSEDPLVQAAAPEAKTQASHEPRREEEEADEQPVEDRSVQSIENAALVQTIPTPTGPVEQAVAAEPEAEVAITHSAEHARATPPDTAVANEQSSRAVQAAAPVDEEPTEVAPTSEMTEGVAPTTEGPQATSAVEDPLEPLSGTREESDVGVAQPQAANASLEGNGETSDRSPRRSSQEEHTLRAEAVPAGAPVAAPASSQPQPRNAQPPQEESQLQSVAQAQAQAGVTQTDETADNEPTRADEGERREKWFVQDDEGSRADQAEVRQYAASDATENHSPLDPLAPTPSAADSSSVLGSPDALNEFGQMNPADALTSAAAGEVSAAAVLAQPSGSTSASSGRSDTRSPSQSVGQVTGGRTPAGLAAQGHSAASADGDQGGVAGLSQQERVRLVQRVARSFSRLGPDGGQVTLKLHPPQLGVLNMSVRIEGQTMTARLQTETAGARDAILENLPVLRERLAEQGIEVESFQVEVASDRDPTANNPSQSQGQNPFSGEGASGSRGGTRDVDYRRVARNNSGLRDVPASARGTDSSGWSPSSLHERTLDIRA